MSSPFNQDRYERLLEGLEITILPLSVIRAEHLFFRIDSEHYQRAFLANIARIKQWPSGFVYLGDELVEMTGGATPLGANYPESGVRFLRVQNIMQNYIDDSVLTITGVSYGKSAVVTPSFAGSNINQHSVRMKFKRRNLRPFFVSTFLNAQPGKLQSDQNIVGVTRPALDYRTIRNFVIPRVSDVFQKAVEEQVRLALDTLEESRSLLLTAEQILLEELGLADWTPPEPLTYQQRARDVFATRRLDSQFFDPKYNSLTQWLERRYPCIFLADLGAGAVTKGRSVSYVENGPVKMVRSGDLVDLDDEDRFLTAEDSPAVFRLKNGDVLISSIGFGSIGKVQVFDKSGKYGTVSDVTVIRQKRLNSYYLMFFLRSIAGQLQIERYITGATGQLHLYPKDVAKIIVPELPSVHQEYYELQWHNARSARQQAHGLLERAKRAVEIAIEDSETAGLAYLNKEGG